MVRVPGCGVILLSCVTVSDFVGWTTQATLGAEVGKVEKGKTNLVQLQCTVKNKEPVYLCALIPGQSVTCHLDLEFEEKYVTFSVLGPRSVHLAGYYVGYPLFRFRYLFFFDDESMIVDCWDYFLWSRVVVSVVSFP